MYAIEFNNVSKKFKKGEKAYALRDLIPQLTNKIVKSLSVHEDLKQEEFWAIRDVSFKVKKGEVLGIIGPNGAGKSTILKILSKVTRPTVGEIKVCGRLSALIEVTAGFHPDFTGRENIYFNGAILGMTTKEIDQKFDEIVDFSGVSEFIDTPVKRYSSGMMARLGFAIAAHVNPDVMLVDEVLSVGDRTFQAKCTQKMRELLQSGVTIIFISHNIPLVQNLCERVILFHRGKILKDGIPEEVIPQYENLVHDLTEQEVRKQLEKDKAKVYVEDEPMMKILNVTLCDADKVQKDVFTSFESMGVSIEFQTENRVNDPIFSVSIVRSDGVICCYTDTKDSKVNIKFIEGRGRIYVDLGTTRLTPGAYYTKVSVWDKDYVHPYVIAKAGVFKIDSTFDHRHVGNVYFLDTKWSVE